MSGARPPVLLFPGQGTEGVGMSAGWEEHGPWVRTLEAAEAHGGRPLRRLMAAGPAEALRAQDCAPAAVLAHSVGVYRTWRAAAALDPIAAAGHSMGFYSALVAAEVVPLEVILDLFAEVDRLGAAAFSVPMGMAFAIGVSEMEVRAALAERPELVLSNRNGRAQFTVSGPCASLEALVAALRPAAMKVGLLPVRHPLHGPHMAALLPPLARRLAAVRPRAPRFPLVSSFDGRLIRDGAEAWDEGLATVALPVDWLAVAARLKALDAPLLECGHGAQLTGLTRWADRELVARSLQTPPSVAERT